MGNNLFHPLGAYLNSSIGLPTHKFELISDLFEIESLEKGEFLVKKEQYANKMIYLCSGYIRCYSYSKGKDITHWVYWKNRLVTDIPSFKRIQVSSWNYQAITKCNFFSLNYTNYNKVKAIIPDWDSYENKILTMFFIALENRLYTFLSMNAKERYHFLFNTHSEIFNQIPLIYISSLLGMTPETISRIRKKSIS